jgi:predicted AlkP superfamily pyrophosphatase or phosphodiesterase
VLRQAGLLSVRAGHFGEQLETFESQAFAVCDHQLAHVYLNDPSLMPTVESLVRETPGVSKVYVGEGRRQLGLDHARAGDLIAVSERNAWFAYPFWLEDGQAPDFARTVDIHRKPGYDPCELFFDPALTWPLGRAMWRLCQKKLGFRTLFDVIPLNANLVRGSHGLAEPDLLDKPLLIGEGVSAPSASPLPMTAVRDLLLAAMDLA